MEGGARLVACAPGSVQCVVQLPRGNLETVQPRLLVLSAIAEQLSVDAYLPALQLAAVSRVDLNFVVDYTWPRFLDHAPSFVAQVPL